MPYDLTGTLVIGISSRALFDLARENEIFERDGLEKYRQYQRQNETVPPAPGVGFPLVRALLALNQSGASKRVEVIMMSQNSADTCVSVFNAAKHYAFDIVRGAFTNGEPLAPYLTEFKVDLFLSASEKDVQAAVEAGVPAGLIWGAPATPDAPTDQVRIAFDGDAVLFSDESERVYEESHDLELFMRHEVEKAHQALPRGPLARLAKSLSVLKSALPSAAMPIRTALVTARNSPAHERVIRTLRDWGVDIDAAFFLGGLPKDGILRAFRPHIFFDDQQLYCDAAAKVVPTVKVPRLLQRSAAPAEPSVHASQASVNEVLEQTPSVEPIKLREPEFVSEGRIKFVSVMRVYYGGRLTAGDRNEAETWYGELVKESPTEEELTNFLAGVEQQIAAIPVGPRRRLSMKALLAELLKNSPRRR